MVDCVYLVECYKDENFFDFYTGQINNLEIRRNQDIKNVILSDANKYAGHFDNIKFVLYEIFEKKDEALKRKQYINDLSLVEKERFIEEFEDREMGIDRTKYFCEECPKNEITKKENNFSVGQFGRPLCRKHQDDELDLPSDYPCDECGYDITEAEYKYSKKHFERLLCRDCQDYERD